MIRQKMSIDRQAETISGRRRFLQGHYTSSARTATAQTTHEVFITLDEKHDVWHLVARAESESSHDEIIQGLEGTAIEGSNDRELGKLAATVDSLSSRMSAGNENHVRGMMSSEDNFDFGDGYLRIADTNHGIHDTYSSSDLFGRKTRGPDAALASSLDEDESCVGQATRRGHSQKENGGRSSRVVQSTSEIEPPAHQGVNGLHSEARAIAEPRALNSSPSFGPPNFIPQSDDHETQRDLAQDEQRGGGTRTHGHEASADTDVDVESTATDADQGPRHPKDDMERSREDMARTPCVASSVELVAERGKADGRKCFTDRSLTGKANTAELGAGSPNSSPRTTGQNAPSAVEHQPPSRLMKDPIASNVKSSKRAEEDDDHHQVDVGGGGNDPPLGRAARGSYRITWRGRDVLVPQCSVKVVDATGKFVSARACPGESMDRLSSSRSSGVWRRSSPGEGRQRIKLEEEPNDPDGRVLSRTYLSAGPDFVREDDDRSEEKGVEHDAYRRRDEGRGTHAKAAAPESATLRGSFSTEIERMRHDDGERHRPRSSQVHDDEPERSSPLPHKRPEIKYKSCSPLPSLPARGQRYRRCSIQHGRLDCGEAPRQGGGSRQGSHPGYCPQVPVYFSATPYMGPPVSACPRAWAGNKVVREMHDACATATLPGRRSFPRRNPSSREAPDCHETGVDNPERVRAEHPRVAVHDDTGEQLTESDGKSGNDRYRGDMSSHGYKRTSGDDFDGCSSEAQAKDTAERQRFPHKCDDTADMKAKATWDK